MATVMAMQRCAYAADDVPMTPCCNPEHDVALDDDDMIAHRMMLMMALLPSTYCHNDAN